MKNEIKELTILRAFAILVILLTHLHNYVDMSWLWKIYAFAANIGLSIFVFISGYTLALGKDITSINIFLNFSKHKLIRIYSLYVPALVIFTAFSYIGTMTTFSHNYPNKIILFVDHLFSLQLFFANIIPPIFTLWYIGLIVPYYIIYGFSGYLISLNNNAVRAFGEYTVINVSFVIAIFFGVIFVLNSFYSIIDQRFVTYLPVFIMGIFFSEKKYFKNQKLNISKGAFLTFVIFLLFLFFLFCISKLSTHFSFCYPIIEATVKMTIRCMVVLLFLFVLRFLTIRDNSTLSKITILLSYSSFSVYLFHRPILEIVKVVLSYLQVGNVYFLLTFYSFIVLPLIVFPISYIIQKLNDQVVGKKLIRGETL